MVLPNAAGFTENESITFLPRNTIASEGWVGRHLNITLPLPSRSERNDLRSSFPKPGEEVYGSEDHSIKSYYQLARQTFYSMKDSPDNAKRLYYAQVIKRSRQQYFTTVNSNKRCDFLRGVRRKLSSGMTFTLFDLTCRVPSKHGCSPGTDFWVHCNSIPREEASLHPHIYATKALPEDPAFRLGIFVQRTHRSQGKFEAWLETPGEKAPKNVNTFVDTIEDDRMFDIVKRPRRHIPKHFQIQFPQYVPSTLVASYTS